MPDYLVTRRNPETGITTRTLMTKREYNAYRRARTEERDRIQDVDPVRDTAARRRALASTNSRDVREPAPALRAGGLSETAAPPSRQNNGGRQNNRRSRNSSGSDTSGRSASSNRIRSSAAVDNRRVVEEPIPGRAPPVPVQLLSSTASRSARSSNTIPQPSSGTAAARAARAARARQISNQNAVNITTSGTRPETVSAPVSPRVSPAYSSRPQNLYTPDEIPTPVRPRPVDELGRRRAPVVPNTSEFSQSAPQQTGTGFYEELLAAGGYESPEELEDYDPFEYEEVPVPVPLSRAPERATASRNNQTTSNYDAMLAAQLAAEMNDGQLEDIEGYDPAAFNDVIEVFEDDGEFEPYNPADFADSGFASSSRSRQTRIPPSDDFPEYDASAFEATSYRPPAPRRRVNDPELEAAQQNRDRVLDESLMVRLGNLNVSARSGNEDERGQAHFFQVENVMNSDVVAHTKQRFNHITSGYTYTRRSEITAYTDTNQIINQYLPYADRDMRSHESSIRAGLNRVTASENRESVVAYGMVPREAMVGTLSYILCSTHSGDKKAKLMDAFFSALRDIGTIDPQNSSKYIIDCPWGQVTAFLQVPQRIDERDLEADAANPAPIDDNTLKESITGKFRQFTASKGSEIESAYDRAPNNTAQITARYRQQFKDSVKRDIIDGTSVNDTQFSRVFNQVFPANLELQYMV